MRTKNTLVFAVFVAVAVLTFSGASIAGAQTLPYDEGTQDSGAIYRVYLPVETWNQDLIVHAHGYVDPDEPIHIVEEHLYLPDGTYLPQWAVDQDFAFATTSYSTNGLAVAEGLVDVVDLVDIFETNYETPRRVYLIGMSEGGLITTLAVEQYPEIFDGGLAACAPLGDFREQMDYIGDFRVVFDYFFPDLMPSSPISIPQSLMDGWDTYYTVNILPEISAPQNAAQLTQLFGVTEAPYDTNTPDTAFMTVYAVLRFNVFATNDAEEKLGGQPFDNQERDYSGSMNDIALNAGIARFSADQSALDTLAAETTTTGQLQVPLVTLHTPLDPVVPYWHEALYEQKVAAQGRTNWLDSRVVNGTDDNGYGHCTFTTAEAQDALMLLVSRVDQAQASAPTMTEWGIVALIGAVSAGLWFTRSRI